MKDYTQNLGYWVKRYSILANQAIDAELKQYGIGRSQWYLLLHLHEDESLSQRRLQDILQIESATLTNLVASLVKKGLIQQQVDIVNKRQKNIMLTVNGKKLRQQLPDPIETVKIKAHHGIADNDIITAREVLEMAVHNLEKI